MPGGEYRIHTVSQTSDFPGESDCRPQEQLSNIALGAVLLPVLGVLHRYGRVCTLYAWLLLMPVVVVVMLQLVLLMLLYFFFFLLFFLCFFLLVLHHMMLHVLTQ